MNYKLLKKIFLDLFKHDQIKYSKTRILTLAHDHNRSFFFEGKYYSPLVDTLQDDLYKRSGIECLGIARIISTIKGDMSYGRVYSPEGAFARALVKKRIKSVFYNGRYPYSKSEEKIWGNILDTTGTEKVIGILPSRELCVACHKRGIWVADIQHGVIANNHPWYGRSFRESDPREQLPDAFCVWEQGSVDVIEPWASKKNIEVKLIGNQWLRRFSERDPKDHLVNSTLKSYEEKFKRRPDEKVILVGLSSSLTGVPNGIITENLIKLIQKTHKKYRWILRLHPNQVKGFRNHESKAFYKIYNKQLKGYAEWEIPTQTSLPAVLLNCDLHIAWNSSVAIEAAQLGIKSALSDPRFRGSLANDYYDYYHKKGFIDFIDDDPELLENWIDTNLSKRAEKEDYSSYNKNYYDLLDFLAK